MKKIIKLNESDLLKIINRVISEQGLGRPIPSNFGQDIISQVKSNNQNIILIQKKLKDLRYNLGKSGSNGDGVDGVYGRLTRLAVQDFQRKNGLIPIDGIVGPNTARVLGVDPLSNEQIKILKTGGVLKGTAQTKTSKTSDQKQKITIPRNLSKQVQKQLSYMKQNNFFSNERFTILDDTYSKIYLFEPNYQFYKSFDVITGKHKGDQLKTKSMGEWALENWYDVLKYFGKAMWARVLKIGDILEWDGTLKDTAMGDVIDYVDRKYFDQAEWKIKNTPSGVFKRTGLVENFMGDLLATTFLDDQYGKRFISFETCAGKTIPFGFHGTKSSGRLEVLPGGDKYNPNNSKNRKMSFGCINFADSDVLEVSKFLTMGQKSIWLPGTGKIEPIPPTCL